MQYLIKMLQEIILQILLGRFLQDFSYLARKASHLVQHLQDLVQHLASLARKILARFGYFLQDGFYWDVTDIYKSEKVQRRAAQWISSDYSWHTSVASLLSSFSMPTLQHR